jgi:hypothetical protein
MRYHTRCLHMPGLWSPFSPSSSNTRISYTSLEVSTSISLAGLTPCGNVFLVQIGSSSWNVSNF